MTCHISTSSCFTNQSVFTFNINNALSTALSRISEVLYWSRTCVSTYRFSNTALSHISLFLRRSWIVLEVVKDKFESYLLGLIFMRSKSQWPRFFLYNFFTWALYWLETNFNASSSLRKAFSHIHLVLYLSGTTSSNKCSSSSASLDIFWVLHLWKTHFNANVHPPTNISHISWVLYWLRTYSNPNDHLQTAISNNSQVLYRSARNRCPGIWTPFKSSFTYLWVPKAVKDKFQCSGFFRYSYSPRFLCPVIISNVSSLEH